MKKEPHTPYEQKREDLLTSYDICTKSNLTYFWSGEHSVIDGGVAMVGRIPQEVLVGIKGKMTKKDAEKENAPKIEAPKAIDPVIGKFDEDVSALLYYAEELKDLSAIIRDIPYKMGSEITYLPAEVKIVSATPPGRGCNFSGALASALSTSILLLNGVELGLQNDKPNWAVPVEKAFSQTGFDKAFRYAMKLEKVAHEEPSGYGPFFGLLYSNEEPFIFAPIKSRDDIIRDVIASSWSENTTPLGERSDLAILVVDSGVAKSTKETIRSTRGEESEMQDSMSDYLNKSCIDENKFKETLFQETIKKPGPLHRILDGLSLILINTVRNYCNNYSEENFRKIIQVVKGIDQVHGLIGLHWDPYVTIRELLYCRYGDDIGCKLTGGGGGGNFLVFTKKELMPQVYETLSPLEVGIIYDSMKSQPPTKGTVDEKWTNPDQIEEIKHIAPLKFTYITSERVSTKVIKATKKLEEISKFREMIAKNESPQRLVIADKDSKSLTAYKLHKHKKKQNTFQLIKYEKSGFNIEASISLLNALAKKSVVDREDVAVKANNIPELSGKLSYIISSNITSPLRKLLVEKEKRNPFAVKSGPREGESRITLNLPNNCGIITISRIEE